VWNVRLQLGRCHVPPFIGYGEAMKIPKFFFALLVIAFTCQACDPRDDETFLDEIPVTTTSGDPTVTPVPPLVELTPTPLKAGFGFRNPWFELYFTDPDSSFADQRVGGVDGLVGASISSAKQSIDVAFNSLSIDNITSALIRAHVRGVQVRIVMESNYLRNSEPQRLVEAGIPVVDDQRDGVMHNEFIVIDNNRVWTGSTNFTDTDVYRSNNNLISIYSKEIAQNYTTEFEEMFLNDQFGLDVNPSTPYPSVTISGTRIDVLFSPDDVVSTRLISLVSEAKESIYFMASSFGLPDLGQAIRQRALSGVKVMGLIEAAGVVAPSQVTEYSLFREAGLDVRLDGNPASMNHNVIIIDGSIVVVGSYIFVYGSEVTNDENLLVIYNDKVAEKFLEEFQRVQSEAQPLD
jgi:phosphatidylserine/phosphatidylglycerophosphate/cardiolipin synthase-like enzyme